MAAACRLRRRLTAFLPGTKGGLYGWEQVRRYPEVILVEGLFDYAVLWQAGLQRHLLDGKPSQRAPVPATLRRSPNRLFDV